MTRPATFACRALGVLGLLAATPALTAPASWSYQGAAGPAHWGEVDPAFRRCSDGSEQSPIALGPAAVTAAPEALIVHWQPGVFHIVNTGHGIEADAPPGSTIMVAGRALQLRQFHVHLPAEHALVDHRAAMEVHFVHQDSAGQFAVIAVLIEPGRANPLLHAMLAAAPATPDAAAGAAPIDPHGLLPKHHRRFRYEGSLTTPPCAETVDWEVMATPITAASADIEGFRRLIGDNARPLQPRGRRFVLRLPG